MTEQEIREKAKPLIRRAVNDPSSIVDRGPRHDLVGGGETLGEWQARAVLHALADAGLLPVSAEKYVDVKLWRYVCPWQPVTEEQEGDSR